MNRFFAAVVALLISPGLLLSGVAPMTTGAQGEPLKVVATFSILADIVQQIGGDQIQVTTLVTPNMDAHSFEPTPDQIVELTDASLIFEIGIGFEPWLDGMVDASRPDAARIVVSSGVSVRSATGDHEHEDAQEPDDGHDHGADDPHIWHNPLNVAIMTENIRDALIAADPAHETAYASNAAAYLTALTDLDQWIEAQVSTIPAEFRKLVTSHDTFGYFADRYGFEVIGAALGTSTAGSEPSARDVANLIDTIQSANVPAIFTENVSNPDLMEQIAQNAGVDLAPPLYTDALGEPGTPGDSYLGIMRYNTETIVSALTS